MTRVLSVMRNGPRDVVVRATADALVAVTGDVFGTQVQELVAPSKGQTSAEADVIITTLAEPSIVLGVVAADPGPDALCWRVVGRTDKPVVLVPPGAPEPCRPIRRALVPLDGTFETSLAVAETVRLLDRAGADLVVLHVFDAATVPGFWDQPAHTYQAWADEFATRFATPRSARLELRSGSPGEHVLDVAADADVDLVALAWSQHLQPTRARTVRASVLKARVPVLLMPIGNSTQRRWSAAAHQVGPTHDSSQ
jgi:nucleotide-binding universal stress UspA family protein